MSTQHETRTKGRKGQRLSRICIWSIRNHSLIVSRIQRYIYSAVAVLLLLVMAGRLTLETALQIIGFGGLGLIALIYGLIVSRQNLLLAISDPVLKQQAYQAMLELIAEKGGHPTSASAEKGAKSGTHLDGCGHC